MVDIRVLGGRDPVEAAREARHSAAGNGATKQFPWTSQICPLPSPNVAAKMASSGHFLHETAHCSSYQVGRCPSAMRWSFP